MLTNRLAWDSSIVHASNAVITLKCLKPNELAVLTAVESPTPSNRLIELFQDTSVVWTSNTDCFKDIEANAGLLLACTADGRLLVWDFRLDVLPPLFTSVQLDQLCLSSLAMSSNAMVVAIGVECDSKDNESTEENESDEDEDSSSKIIFVDISSFRNALDSNLTPSAKVLGAYSEAHSETVTALAFKPGDSNWLLSGSVDGLVNSYDLKNDVEDDALTQSFNCESTVARCGWLRDRKCDYAYAITDDMCFYVWDPVSGDEHFSMKNVSDAQEKAFSSDNRCAKSCGFSSLVDAFVLDHRIFLIFTNARGEISTCYWSKTDGFLFFDQTKSEPPNKDFVRCVEFDSSAGFIYFGADDGSISTFRFVESKPNSDGALSKREKRKARKRRLETSQ